ncbi:hypothetical protein L593_12985 [Salinarchaeum sp. Harcht-Bsk1]|uniref:hypothetical protein n=1 Tax=Salinarchaeum sp. Harcht-Bsk1 TaxID=1333523 RepID=UPI0003424255|nr:hypothetical protein [Salinarchaeum sp. Harcht-Bsk1]AGN02536.1 hypothetical protein L593_12985 [Salinarchaeum sp. Harcht-Bsk1]
MRPDRRSVVAGAALLGVAVLALLDPLGLRAAIGSWFRVAGPASGSTRAIGASIQRRHATVDSLEAALAADPTLSLALLATGIGVGLIGGSIAAYLHQRRRIRRGERDA